MTDQENIPDEQEVEADIVDIELEKIIDEIVGTEGDDDDFDRTADVVFDIIEELVDRGEIEEIPEDGEEAKLKWMTDHLQVLKAAIKEALEGGFVPEPTDGNQDLG